MNSYRAMRTPRPSCDVRGSFLAGFGLADQPIPDFVWHSIFRGVRISWRGDNLGSGREFLKRIGREVNVRRTLLQSRSLWHHRYLFQLLVIETTKSVAALAEVKGRKVRRNELVGRDANILSGQTVRVQILLPLVR